MDVQLEIPPDSLIFFLRKVQCTPEGEAGKSSVFHRETLFFIVFKSGDPDAGCC